MRHSLLASVLLVMSVVPASAVDVPLAGDRARLSDLRAQRRAQVISYSSAIDVSTLDPTVSGATLDLYSVTTGEQLTLSLPANVWEGPLPGRRFRFTGTGDPKMKILLVNGRLVRITLKGPGGFPLGGVPQVAITARLTLGDRRFCMVFGGVTKDDGTRFVAHAAPPPATCPAAPNDAPPPFCVGKPDGTACDDGKACTASSRCVAGVCASESPTCTGRLYDQNFCNLATGACETSSTTCPTHPSGDLCRALDTDINAATGACFYQVPTICHSLGCNPSLCNPATGGCEEVLSPQCDAPCSEPTFPDEPCFAGTCTEERCVPNSDDIPNCNAESIVNCNAGNFNNCIVPIPDDNLNNVFQGCREGVGCVYTAIDCTVSQPSGPPAPCMEYYNDPDLAGCCAIRPTDCAGKFGNAPGYTYSCDPTTNTCRATPE